MNKTPCSCLLYFPGTLLLLMAAAVQAALPSFVWEPGRPTPAPAWVASTHFTPGLVLDAYECRVLPPPDAAAGQALALVLYYEDGGEGILRVLWSSPAGEITLADRLLEGAPLPNRRTLLIQPAEVAQGGTLIIQQGVGSGRFLRAKMHWVQSVPLMVENLSSPPALYLDGLAATAEEIQGAPPTALGDAFHGHVSAAMLQEAPISLAEDPAFALELSEVPRHVLLECEVGNLPPEAFLHLWINGTPATVFQAELPDLWDAGWMEAADAPAPLRFAGWRKARAWINPALLAPGDNLLQIYLPGAAPAPVLRRLRLQAAFPVPLP